MAVPLREFIANRRVEIKTQISALKAELRDLEVAERALAPGAENGGADTDSSGRPTIQGMIAQILVEFPNGLDASQIGDEIKRRFGKELARSSISPQLSRLKTDGKIRLDGKIWTHSAVHTKSPGAPSDPGDNPLL